MLDQTDTTTTEVTAPWARYGKPLEGGMTPDEMLQAAGLDWEVELWPMVADEPTNERLPRQVEIKDRRALVRPSDMKVIDTVGPNWVPTQNHEAFGLFDAFCRAGHMTMEVAGCVPATASRGLTVWALAKMDQGFELRGGDETEFYMLLINHHVYGKAIQAMLTPIRLACLNAMTIALSHQATQRIGSFAHLSTITPERFDTALASMAVQSERYQDAAEQLASVRWSVVKRVKFFNRVLAPDQCTGATPAQIRNPLTARVAKAVEAYSAQPGAELCEGTAWQAFNAVTYLTNHVLGHERSRLASTWFNVNARTNDRALKIALEMTAPDGE